MTRRQWSVLLAVALVTAAALGTVLAVGSPDRAPNPAAAGPTGSTTAPTTESTLDLSSVTTVDLAPVPTRPTTTAVPLRITVPTTAAPPTTTTTSPPPVLGASYAFLTAPASATTRSGDPQNCPSLADPGWSASCGPVPGLAEAWLIETRTAGAVTGWRAYVLRLGSDGQWDVALSALDDQGTAFSSVKVATADVTGDGVQEAVFGFHDHGGGIYVEVVAQSGRVTLHHGFPVASVSLSNGQIDAWWSLPNGGTNVEHDVIVWLSGSWRLVATSPGAPPAPPSQI